MKQTEILTHGTHVNGWFPAVYTSFMSQNFRLFHVSNLSVRNFRIFLLMYTWSLTLLPSVVRLSRRRHREGRLIGAAGAARPVQCAAGRAKDTARTDRVGGMRKNGCGSLSCRFLSQKVHTTGYVFAMYVTDAEYSAWQ